MDKWYVNDNKELLFYKFESEQHLLYVQGYTKIIAKTYAMLYPKARMTNDKIDKIVKASRLHDIGKLAVPDWILLRNGQLSEGELDILEAHTVKGCEMIYLLGRTEDEEYNRICHNIVLYHHEKYDGTGYPYGLKKDKIPKEAQIVGLADVYDTLIHGKGERKYFTKEEAFQMLLRDEFGQISPRLRECLIVAKEELEAFSVEDVMNDD